MKLFALQTERIIVILLREDAILDSGKICMLQQKFIGGEYVFLCAFMQDN